MTRKLIIHDGRAERELVLIGTLTVGRDPSCHINDLDPLLSRRHAEFVTTRSGCTVRDLGSRNGMLVNGAKVREQLLKVGDLVQLGHLQLRYVEDEAVTTPDAAKRSNATTAHEAATVAVINIADQPQLDDTKPHIPHAHAHVEPPDDVDATRAPAARKVDDEPTMAPRGQAVDDVDATAAPVGRRTQPAVDLDATVARGSVVADPDATFIAGARLGVPLSKDPAPPSTDFDATGVGRRAPAMADTDPDLDLDIDKTIAPGSLHLDATFAPVGMASVERPAAMPPMEARLTAGADLRITAATAGCRAHFNIAPDTLVGRPLGEVLTERLNIAAAGGPSEVTLAVERSPIDRSLIVILKAAQIETVS